jgi:UDP-N-acetylmuramoyl-tripeptide--D-alanyl-D-alanine ligase
MRVFGGIKNTSIIDDTYNASPVAVKAALDVLYAARASQRIAVLGSMNEMGAYAKTAHQEVGEYCDAHKLDYVLTLGADAARWIAPAAKVRGCQVHSFTGADACAAYVRKHLQERAVVLVKGSQNGVFAEEVVKQLLAQPKDAENLVRQSPAWLRKKARQA